MSLLRQRVVNQSVNSRRFLQFLVYRLFSTVRIPSGRLRTTEFDKLINGISPDERSYDALVLRACRAGKVEAAIAILRRMEEDGVNVLYSTHAHVIAAIVDEGYYALGLEFVITYAGNDLRLDAESFGILVSKLVKRNRFEEAKIVFKEMVRRGLRIGNELRQFYEKDVRNDDDDNSRF